MKKILLVLATLGVVGFAQTAKADSFSIAYVQGALHALPAGVYHHPPRHRHVHYTPPPRPRWICAHGHHHQHRHPHGKHHHR